ncbi:MAG: hypothetical protein B5M55_08760 [Desulfococcus sp. 4484_242]|nr:MAG: hypothetical protein B5M55_08760 [Desulfococcus sp. 4484_242]
MFLTAAFGIVCLAAGVQACLLIKAKWYEVVIFLIVAFLMIKPGLVTDGAGFALFALVFISQWLRKKRGIAPTAAA